MLVVDELSIAAPAYNEGETLPSLVAGWAAHLRTRPYIKRFEIVICDDGSRDQTPQILHELARQYSELRALRFDRNQGAAAALSFSISRTSLQWVLLIDSDGQFPIENLDRLVAAATTQNVKAVIGVRARKADTRVARFGSWSSGLVCNFVHRTRYRDFNCALKLVEGSLLRGLPLEAKGLNYSTEVTSKLIERGMQLAEVDIDHAPRAKGKSNLRLARDALHRFLFVLYISFRQILLRLQVLQRPTS